MGALLVFAEESRARVYDVLLCMMWADGRVTRGELIAARGAAIALGLPADTVGHEVATAGKILCGSRDWVHSLHELGLESLDGSEGRLAYACAAWMALTDGVEHPWESDLL